MFDTLKCKFAIFFILISLFHLLFWYYLSSFCAVYKNTQGTLIINKTRSMINSLFFYPFIICLIPCTMRYIALRKKFKYNEHLYNLSNILVDIL